LTFEQEIRFSLEELLEELVVFVPEELPLFKIKKRVMPITIITISMRMITRQRPRFLFFSCG
jgi:hypothetical protein